MNDEISVFQKVDPTGEEIRVQKRKKKWQRIDTVQNSKCRNSIRQPLGPTKTKYAIGICHDGIIVIVHASPRL